MLNFVLIFTIFLEIVLCIITIKKLIDFDKRIIELNKKIKEYGKIILEIFGKIKVILSKINRVVAFFRNEKFRQTKRLISMTINIIQIIILIHSLDFSKGFKKSLNFKNFKKILFASVVKKLFRYCL